MAAKKTGLPPWLKIQGEDFLLNTTAVCRLFDVSRAALTKWTQAGCPKEGRGLWNPRNILLWRKGNFGDDDPEASDMRSEKTIQDVRWRKARAQREEIMVGVLTGQYVGTNEVLAAWADRVVETRQALLSLPGTLATELANQDEITVQEKLKKEVYSILEGFARSGEHTQKME